MKDLLVLIAHLLTTIAKLLEPGGTRAVVADNLLMKPQLLIMNPARRRAPNLTTLDRFLLGFGSLLVNPRRIPHAAVIIRPYTSLKFHQMLERRKYRLLEVDSSAKSPYQQLVPCHPPGPPDHRDQEAPTTRGFYREPLINPSLD